MISKFFSLGNDKLGILSLSSAVYFNSLEVAFKSIINKPLVELMDMKMLLNFINLNL